MRTTMEAVKEHRDYVLEHYPLEQLLGIFLYGSQNYGISTETSDVDTKAVLIPTIEDLRLKQPISRELHLPNNEHCEVKDIRELAKMFKKQNINFIEILYTDYCWINLKYNSIWREYFVKNREYISHMNPRYTIMSITGQAIHTLKQNKTDGKNFANGLRLYYFLTSYLEDGMSYEFCLDMNYQGRGIKEEILAYKKGEIQVNEKETDKLIKKFYRLQDVAQTYSNEPNNVAEKMLDKGVIALITNEKMNYNFYYERKDN